MQSSLRCDDPAQRMMPGQHNPPMIDLGRSPAGLAVGRQAPPLHQGPAAGRTPIRHGLFVEHCPALAANPLHD